MFYKLLIHVSLGSESKSSTDVFQHGKPCNFLVKEYSFPETTSSVLLSRFPVGFFFMSLGGEGSCSTLLKVGLLKNKVK